MKQARIVFWGGAGWAAGLLLLALLASLSSHKDESLRSLHVQLPLLLNEENALRVSLIRLRYGIDSNYDSVNGHFGAIKDFLAQVDVESLPDDLEAGISEYRKIVGKEMESVEDFKYQNAMVRNSLRYFQYDSLHLAETMARDAAGQTMRQDLTRLANGILLMTLDNDAGLRTDTIALAERVNARNANLHGKQRETLTRLMRHARLLVDMLPRLDTSMRELLDSGSIERLQATSDQVDLAIAAESRQADVFQVVWILLAISCFIAVAVIAMRYLDNIRQTAAQRRFLQSLTDNVGVGVLVADEGGRLTFVNPHAEALLGYGPGELVGKGFRQSVHADAGGAPQREEPSHAVEMTREGQSFVGEVSFRKRDGESLPVLLHAAPFGDGERKAMVLAFQDLSEIREARHQLERMAYFDTLTGLPNRVLLQDRILQSLAHARRQHSTLALFMLDLDNFKSVNDSLGHAAGDELLRQVALRIKDSLRETDTAARLGGDEFAILISDEISVDDAAILASKLIQVIGQPYRLGGLDVVCGASLGITFFPQDANDDEELLRNADAAMFGAKESGKNRFQFYTQDMGEGAMERLRLESQLRHALERGELTLHFQPQCRPDGQAVSAEALLRWNSPELGQVSPARFIPIAERSGLIVEIGEWVLRSACNQCQRWRETFAPDFRVAVNLSAVQFRQADLVRLVADVLAETGLPGDALELEITESMLMAEVQFSQDTLAALKRLGCLLAIDDFGTGYSSLSYLKRFPLDVLKIDRTFINGLGANANDSAVVGAVIGLARSLGLAMVAEGVESRLQFDELIGYGGRDILFQGFLMGYPVPAKELVRRLGAGG